MISFFRAHNNVSYIVQSPHSQTNGVVRSLMIFIFGTTSSCFSLRPLLRVDDVEAVLNAGDGDGVGRFDLVCCTVLLLLET